MSNEIVDKLYKVILDRIEKRPTGSYTAEIVIRGLTPKA